MSATIQVIEEYKESKDFKNDATEAGANTNMVNFIDSKEKVAQAYPKLDQSGILANRTTPEEEEGEEEGATIEEKNTKAAEGLEGPATIPKKDT